MTLREIEKLLTTKHDKQSEDKMQQVHTKRVSLSKRKSLKNIQRTSITRWVRAMC